MKASTGMLWFDNDKTTSFSEKVIRAKEYFIKKYKQEPDFCLVNTETHDGKTLSVGDIKVDIRQAMIKNHFMIGVKNIVNPNDLRRVNEV